MRYENLEKANDDGEEVQIEALNVTNELPWINVSNYSS